jgi:hypothetical protein
MQNVILKNAFEQKKMVRKDTIFFWEGLMD